ncbi:hypothetical protein PPERSA_07673 [Pseudocohnilembus persalinus]|uniref:Uncharacterized protein n=1 Tax=Pseudocohnilembus persalinus TaxID=266149 RepID=A0A0V0QIR1_PSEPJ|nr:hypothetical protein PPERSA_07673 [Pseudocohnilembus persalinus]|eukprot:KRX02028.1 hypothetical protein PPERSA_07673 [Pseudocohnilembus persalinus]
MSQYEILAWTALISFCVQLVGFILGFTVCKGKGDYYYDLFGMCGFLGQLLFVVLFKCLNYDGLSPSQIIGICFIAIWTIRLGSFLVYRVRKIQGDSRFDDRKNDFIRFFWAYFFQWLWNYISALPVLFLLCREKDDVEDFGSPFEIIGIIGYVFGLGLETIADFQKLFFKLDERNKGKFIDQGLWSYSRHPNYLGEFTLWVAIFIFCVPNLEGFEFFSALSPIFIIVLISFISGIPLQEEQADKRWGTLPEFQLYKKRTWVLFLKPSCLNN